MPQPADGSSKPGKARSIRSPIVRRYELSELLPARRCREFAVTDALGKALGVAGGGVLAVGGNEFVQCAEEGDLRQAIAVNALQPRFRPGFREIAECRPAFLFGTRACSVPER